MSSSFFLSLTSCYVSIPFFPLPKNPQDRLEDTEFSLGEIYTGERKACVASAVSDQPQPQPLLQIRSSAIMMIQMQQVFPPKRLQRQFIIASSLSQIRKSTSPLALSRLCRFTLLFYEGGRLMVTNFLFCFFVSRKNHSRRSSSQFKNSCAAR